MYRYFAEQKRRGMQFYEKCVINVLGLYFRALSIYLRKSLLVEQKMILRRHSDKNRKDMHKDMNEHVCKLSHLANFVAVFYTFSSQKFQYLYQDQNNTQQFGINCEIIIKQYLLL